MFSWPKSSVTPHPMAPNSGTRPDDSHSASASAGGKGAGKGGDKGDGKDSGDKGFRAFDPAPLEKGAQALKDIDASPNARATLDLMKEQERTKQLEMKKVIAQNEMQARMQESENIRLNSQEQRKIQNNKVTTGKQIADYKAELEARNRRHEAEEQKRTNEQWLQEQHRHFLKQQEIQKKIETQKQIERRKTVEFQAKMDRETDRIRIKEETVGRIRQERENVDIHMKLNRDQATMERETKLDVLREQYKYWSLWFTGIGNTLINPERLRVLVAGMTTLFVGFYAAKTGTAVAGRFIESRLGKPSLVRETSRFNMFHPFQNLKRRILSRSSTQPKIFNDLVVSQELQNKLGCVATTTRNTKLNNAPFRHVMLHGPPGTGKTMFAKKLALNSGLDYAIMTGGDFAQLGREGVTELHKVFDWAEKSSKGTVLFIDEADAFLRAGRESDTMGEDMRNCLSAFLYRTGLESQKFMIVIASNLPSTLDRAVVDRIDESIKFDLPAIPERKRLFQQYFDTYITKGTGTKISVEGFSGEERESLFSGLADLTPGLSGRQISKLMIAVQSSVYGGLIEKVTPKSTKKIVLDGIKNTAVV